jgi:hypothetical protein
VGFIFRPLIKFQALYGFAQPNLFLLRKEQFGWIVAFRSAKVAEICRGFRGAKGDKGLSATVTNLTDES